MRFFLFLSCSWRQRASSCFVGLQSSSSSDSQSWKYLRSMWRQLIIYQNKEHATDRSVYDGCMMHGGKSVIWMMKVVAVSFVAVGNGLIALEGVKDEAFEVVGVLDAFDEALAKEAFEVPESLGVANKPEPVVLEEIAESAQIILEALIVKVSPHMQLPQVPYITQHLHELNILDELLVEFVGFLCVIRHLLCLFAFHKFFAFLLELIRLGHYYLNMLGQSQKWRGDGNGQLRHLRELDLQQIEKPKTLVILHYCGKRISVPLFQEVPNLAQLLYHHIAKLEQAVLSNEPAWEKNSNAQIVCFEIKKDAAAINAPERESDGDLRSDVLLSLLRIEGKTEESPEELSFRVDVTKVYKYLEIQPFFRFFEESPLPYSQPKRQLDFPYFQFHRVLAQTRISSTFLARRISNGHFYAVKVYSSGARMGLQELRTVEHLQHTDQARKDADLRCGLLVRSHLTALIPHPQVEEGDSDDEISCKYIALASPFFARGTLEELLKDARYNRLKRIAEMDCLNYLKELMWGAHLLHEKYNLIHRAIIPAHLQIDQNGQLRLTAFFSCLPCYGSEGHAAYIHKSSRQTAEAEEAFEEGQFDVGEFTAPEVLKGQPYNYLVDFYAIGVIVRKLYELSQAHQRVPVSQNNENLMMTMINRLTSPDLRDREAIVAEIIEDIERENLEGQEPPLGLSGLVLQDIKIGSRIELTGSKKFIENEDASNGVDLEVITNYFRKPRVKTALTKPSKKNTILKRSKEKQSVKNSRQKSEKCLSKASAQLHIDPLRKVSKKKTGSISKDSQNSQSRQREGKTFNSKKEESPVKRTSKSKSHEKKRKEEGQPSKLFTFQEEDLRLKAPILPKSPKSHVVVRNKSPVVRDKHK